MKNNKLPKIVTILILTLLTSIVWVSFNIYRSFTVKPESGVPEEISKPLSPNLDQNTITKIKSKIFFEDNQVPELFSGSLQTVTTSATPTATPESSPSATPTATASATPTSTP